MSEFEFKKVSAASVEPERSTCGFRQRLIVKDDGAPASVTRLKPHDAAPHWHAHTHEFYYVIEGNGRLLIDGQSVAVAPGDCVWIQPGACHHAEGELDSLIIAMPAFDPSDLFLVKSGPTP